MGERKLLFSKLQVMVYNLKPIYRRAAGGINLAGHVSGCGTFQPAAASTSTHRAYVTQPHTRLQSRPSYMTASAPALFSTSLCDIR
jgi:hypothetical protein